MLACPCGSINLVRNGFYKYKNIKKQKFRCKSCGKTFHERSGYIKKFKTHRKVVLYAVKLYKGGMSSRDISTELENKFGVVRSHVTVLNWVYNRKVSDRITVDVIIDVPCFGCPKKYCDPTDCDKLEDWLMDGLKTYSSRVLPT